MSRRLTLLALLLLVPPALPPLSAAAQGSAPSVTAPAPREGTPGGYVTLTFQAQGQGEYEFAVESPPDWVPVTRTRNVKLNGNTLIPVTFQVPALAPAGESPALVLRVLQGGTEVARAQTQVRVLPRARVALRSPANLSATPGQTLSVPLEVTNLGNQTDTIRLTITNADRQAQLDSSEVTLKPGESRSVNATLKLEPDFGGLPLHSVFRGNVGQQSRGYRPRPHQQRIHHGGRTQRKRDSGSAPDVQCPGRRGSGHGLVTGGPQHVAAV